MILLSSVNALLCTDVNGDGLTDIVAGGNRFDCLPQFGRQDASFGHVLLNKGNAIFEDLSSEKSGLLLNGQVRDIVEIRKGNGRYLMVLQNNDYPAMYKMPDKSPSGKGLKK